MTPDTPTQAAARLLEMAKRPGITPGPYESFNDNVMRWGEDEPFVHVMSAAYNTDSLGRPSNSCDADWFAACDPATITAICTALQEACAERDALRAERSDLSLFVTRLIRRMRAARSGEGIAAGDDALEQQAIGYLRRKGLVSPLRGEADNARKEGA